MYIYIYTCVFILCVYIYTCVIILNINELRIVIFCKHGLTNDSTIGWVAQPLLWSQARMSFELWDLNRDGRWAGLTCKRYVSPGYAMECGLLWMEKNCHFWTKKMLKNWWLLKGSWWISGFERLCSGRAFSYLEVGEASYDAQIHRYTSIHPRSSISTFINPWYVCWLWNHSQHMYVYI